MKYYSDQFVDIYCGHVLDVLGGLPDECIQMAITSPPYWGLRSYSGGTDIVWPDGWKGQLGLEPTPEFYVDHLMMIFREVKRVLRRDGSMYLNISDTFSANRSYQVSQTKWQSSAGEVTGVPMVAPIQPKCMVCIPERVMLAMIDDGWILRNKCIWRKPNCLPGSQKDRFTVSWEYLYFFVKNNTTILWRNRETCEWRDTRPTREEKYPWGGMYQNIETSELSWKRPPNEEKDLWARHMPLWMGFDYYFELDNVRLPHATQSLERYQRGVNLGRPAEGKSAEVGPMQQYKRAPQWFKEMYPPDKDYKGKFDKPDWREQAAKKGQLFGQPVAHQGGGNTGLRRRKSQQPVDKGCHELPPTVGDEAFNPKGKNPGDIIEGSKPRKYDGTGFGTDGKGIRDHKGNSLNYPLGRNPGDTLTARQEKIVSHFEKRGSGGHYLYGGLESDEGVHEHPLGKNPSDFWEITTKPSKVKHYAAFPPALVERPIKASSRVGDVVMDPLAGTGTTAVVAKRLGRKTILIDCTEEYCAIMKERISRVEYQPELGME